jgi:hypothetical protein
MAKAKKVEAAVEVEQVQTGGLGIDEGIVIGTFFALLTAIVLVYMQLKGYPDRLS